MDDAKQTGGAERTAPAAAPEGFEPLFRSSPFLERCGSFYYRKEREGFVIGTRVEPSQANARGHAHGGFLLTLADVALGYCTAFSAEPPSALVTASMSADFAGSASVGDWIEARVDVQRLGGRLAFANAYLSVGEKRILRASAVFAVNAGALPPAEAPQGAAP